MEINLAGQRALITGGSSGIGEAIVRRLAGAGAKVAINYGHHADAAEAVARSIREKGGEVIPIRS
jgi:NAD(P)-dependent dehydrogenase (short-subunit alcohol dehydrogenase family)